jgi:hypothetical protein
MGRLELHRLGGSWTRPSACLFNMLLDRLGDGLLGVHLDGLGRAFRLSGLQIVRCVFDFVAAVSHMHDGRGRSSFNDDRTQVKRRAGSDALLETARLRYDDRHPDRMQVTRPGRDDSDAYGGTRDLQGDGECGKPSVRSNKERVRLLTRAEEERLDRGVRDAERSS